MTMEIVQPLYRCLLKSAGYTLLLFLLNNAFTTYHIQCSEPPSHKIPYTNTCSSPGSSNDCDGNNTECIQTLPSNGFRCLCADDYFRSSFNVCEPLSRLAVKVTYTQSTSKTAIFKWNADDTDIPVNYTITWSSGTATIDYVNKTGGRLYNLEPDTEYTFNLNTIVPENAYYPEETASATVLIRTMKIPYSDICSTPGSSRYCDDDNTVCLQTPPPGDFRCLCGDGYFRSTSNVCEPLSVLQVKVTSVKTTSRTATFMWKANNRGIPVNYTIAWNSGVGTIDYVNGTGGRLYNLEPNKSYHLILIALVAQDTYYFEKSASTSVSVRTEKLAHGETCGTPGNSSICKEANTKCIQTQSSGGYRCLCGDDYFRNPSNVCEAVTNLKVSVYSTYSTSNSVSFLWNANKNGMPITYAIEWNRSEGKVDYANETGGRVSGLTPDHSYIFSISSTLPASGFYSEKKALLTLAAHKTDKAGHGEPCDSSSSTNLCKDNHTACIQTPLSDGFRCLCQDSYYRSSDDTCRELNDLKVSNLEIKMVNLSEAYLTWTPNKRETSVSYIIESSPGTANVVVPENENGGHVFGLKDKTHYLFTVSSLLPASGYYPQKTVSASVASPSSNDKAESSESSNAGMIAGIVVAVVVVVIIAIVLLVILYRRRRKPPQPKNKDYDTDTGDFDTDTGNYVNMKTLPNTGIYSNTTRTAGFRPSPSPVSQPSDSEEEHKYDYVIK